MNSCQDIEIIQYADVTKTEWRVRPEMDIRLLQPSKLSQIRQIRQSGGSSNLELALKESSFYDYIVVVSDG